MPRGPRINTLGVIHHVMSRGSNGQTIFHEDSDFRVFLTILESAKKEMGFGLYAYCVMSNHFHLLLEPRKCVLSRIMQHVLTRYAMRFNSQKGHQGHVFQARFKSLICNQDSYFMELVRYVHLNPVRAGVVENPGDWPWSSHKEYLSSTSSGLVDREFPLTFFNPSFAEARFAYLDFIGLGIENCREAPDPFQAEPDPIIVEEPQAVQPGPSSDLFQVGEEIAQAEGVPLAMIRGKNRTAAVVRVRCLLIRRSVSEGHPVASVAFYLGCTPAAVYKVIGCR